MKKDEHLQEVQEKKTLSIPKCGFNPRIKKVELTDEKFFAYESQKSHSH